MHATRAALFVTMLVVLGIGGVAVAGTASADAPTLDGPGATSDAEPTGDSTAALAGTFADAHVEECAATPPGDHADPDGGTSDVIGWVDGYWYDEPLEVEGPTIDEDELESLVARTAARVEALRCHAFDEVPPVELLTREEYRESLEPRFDEVSDEEWHFEDARLATMLVAGQDIDAAELQLEVQAAFPAAFYNTEEGVMGFISDDPDDIEIDQVTLAHELTHALQDQQFDIADIFDEPTNDQFIAALAVAEGDATFVDGTYANHCQEARWADECIIPPPVTDAEIPNFALALNQLAAYNTPLVAERFEEGGWEAVDELFETYPDSMVEAIYPDTYGEFERESITVEDRSTGDWERVVAEVDGRELTHDVVGKSGLTAMLVAPTFETQGMVNVVDPGEFQRPHAGGNFNYSLPETTGWQSDELYAYTNAAGDNASVWKLAWEDADEAGLFADAYEDLVEYRSGAPATGYENVFTFQESEEYDMAVAVEHDGDRVWVVTAPTVDELEAVHRDVELLEADVDDADDDADVGDIDDADDADDVDDTDDIDDVDDADEVDDADDADAVDDDGAGFGMVVAIVGLLGVVVVIRGRREGG